MKDGEVIYDDSACEELNEDKETAEAFFVEYLKNYITTNHSALPHHGKRKVMKIKTSKYNEVRLSDVAQYIKVPAQIVKPSTPNGVLIGNVQYEDGKKERVYSDYEVRINNVQLPFAVGEDSYFNSEIEIN